MSLIYVLKLANSGLNQKKGKIFIKTTKENLLIIVYNSTYFQFYCNLQSSWLCYFDVVQVVTKIWLNLNTNFLITSMKHTHLSNFQKQQYTAYLEAQLQKFSAFMLSQRKQNQKYKALEQAISSHSNLIDHLQSKNQMTEFYMRQNASNLQHLAKKCEKIDTLDTRLKRLEDRERFDCDRQARKNYEQHRKQPKTERQNEQRQKILEMSLNELTKKLKKIEEEITKNKENYLPKFGTNESTLFVTTIQENNEKKMKKLEKKMKKYFANRFEEIQHLVKQSKKHRSKSPIARTPIQMSTMSHYETDLIQKPLSQFKLQDHSINKSEVSTILRQSNTAGSRKNKSKIAESKVEKQKGKKNKKDKSRSKSKSKTKEKSENKKVKRSKSRSVSKSKSRKLDRSISYSDNSFIGSEISRSKSKISNNESLDLKKQKKDKSRKQKAKHVSRSKSKSNHSQISMHERCKRRPQYEQMQLNEKSQKQRLKRQKSIKKNYKK